MLLLLDEPFAALDPPSREGLLLDLVDILREANMTTVFVTHDRHEALSLGNRIGILVNGEVVQIGRPWDVFRQPATAAVARLVGAEVMLGGAVVSSTPPYSQVATAVGTIVAAATLPVGTRVTLCLRPEDLTVQPHDPPPHVPSAHNVVLGTLTRVVPWGGQLRVTVDCGIPLTALLPGYCTNALGRQRGQPVAVCFAASAVHVIPAS
jgi:ABC-type Fe3+/spermidine/putrescine transport system ATPase subunit